MSDVVNCNGDCGSCGEGCYDESDKTTITLTLDNDETIECAILTTFQAMGNRYIALLPLDENGKNDDGEVFVYRFHEENDYPVLENIESDEEYAAAGKAFGEWMATLHQNAEERGLLDGSATADWGDMIEYDGEPQD